MTSLYQTIETGILILIEDKYWHVSHMAILNLYVKSYKDPGDWWFDSTRDSPELKSIYELRYG